MLLYQHPSSLSPLKHQKSSAWPPRLAWCVSLTRRVSSFWGMRRSGARRRLWSPHSLFCPLSAVSCPLFAGSCLLSAICCHLSAFFSGQAVQLTLMEALISLYYSLLDSTILHPTLICPSSPCSLHSTTLSCAQLFSARLAAADLIVPGQPGVLQCQVSTNESRFRSYSAQCPRLPR
jgi:hypothetical protein